MSYCMRLHSMARCSLKGRNMKKDLFEDFERNILFAHIMLLLGFAVIDLFLINWVSDIKFAQLFPVEKIVIGLLYALIAAMNIGAVVMAFLQPQKRELEQFLQLYHVTREELSREYQMAEEIVPGWYVSVNYTYFYMGRLSTFQIPIFIKNTDIMSMRYKTVRSRWGLYHYIRLSSLTDKKERDMFCADEKECRRVLQYYEDRYECIVFSYDLSPKKEKDRQLFLKRRYVTLHAQNADRGVSSLITEPDKDQK